jgi:antitoxin component YwqK of YwqJK toxin-antitoxin module
VKSNIHIITERREGTITEGTITERREGTITEGTIVMGGSATKYINYGKIIVFFNKGQITYQINCEVPFPDFKSQLLTPEDVISSYPLKNLVVIKYHNVNIESITGYYNGKKEGKCLEYNNCKLSREMTYIQNKLEGVYIAHSPERIECEYKNGLKHGKETIKYDNNNIKFVGHYIDGKRAGDFEEYRPDGTLVKMTN